MLVVSPATNQSKVAFWVSDSDEAIAEAEAAQEETVERLEEEGVDAAGDTGESEPAVAHPGRAGDLPADRIVVFSHPEGDRDYREDEGLADAEQRFGVPRHARADRALSRPLARSVLGRLASSSPLTRSAISASWPCRLCSSARSKWTQ